MRLCNWGCRSSSERQCCPGYCALGGAGERGEHPATKRRLQSARQGGVRGAEAIWDFYVQVDATWEENLYGVGELVEAPGGAIIVQVTRSASGKTSGAPVRFDYWALTVFRRGKQARIDWFADRAEALEAAGLSE